MASTAKQQSGASQEPSMFLDILTKEEKEALLNKKMEEIRRKNEALRKRHEEIEADKKAAQQMGRLVDPRTQVSVTPNKEPHRNMKGVRDDEKKFGRLAAGRAKRLQHMSKEKLQAQQMHPSAQDHEKGGGVPPGGGSPGQPQPGPGRRRGGSGRMGQPQEPRSPGDSENGPPPDPAFNFLSDRSREGPLPEKIREQNKSTSRHPRNFGGTNFNNVQQRIKIEKDNPYEHFSPQGRQGGPPRSKMEMAMKMTGRERREYSEWKTERERIDQARIDRQLSNAGDWRREWDHHKVEQEESKVERPKVEKVESFEGDTSDSRRTEPGRRPVIGYAVDGQIVRLGDQIDEDTFKNDPDSLEQTLENLADYERDSRGYRDQGRGRAGRSGSRGRGTSRPTSGNYDRTSGNYDRTSGNYERTSGNYDRTSGNYDRHRASSTGSDETSRSVEEQNDSLIVKIDNEFASTPRRFKTSPNEDRGKRRSFDGSSHGSHEDRYENGGDHREMPSQRGGPSMRRGGGSGGGRPERSGRNIYRGGDDGVRSDGYREPPRGRSKGVRPNRGRRAGSGRIPDDRHFHEGDSNLADVEPHVAMGTFDENWDYGDLQPGQLVQIVSADLSEKEQLEANGKNGLLLEGLTAEEERVKSPEDGEEWEDAHDFYDVKGEGGMDPDDSDEDDDDQDPHNSSAESLERFIQEHTLKLDVNVGSMVPPLSPLSDPASPDSSVIIKHPLSAAKVMDWGASENFSDNKSSNASGSLNTSRNAEDMTDLPSDLEDGDTVTPKADEAKEDEESKEKDDEVKVEAPVEDKKSAETEAAPTEGPAAEEKTPHEEATDVQEVDLDTDPARGSEPTGTEATSTDLGSGPATDTEKQAENPLSEPTPAETPDPSPSAAAPASSPPSQHQIQASEPAPKEAAEQLKEDEQLKEEGDNITPKEGDDGDDNSKQASAEETLKAEPDANAETDITKADGEKTSATTEAVVDASATPQVEHTEPSTAELEKSSAPEAEKPSAPEADEPKAPEAEKPSAPAETSNTESNQTSKGEAEPVSSPGATEDAAVPTQG